MTKPTPKQITIAVTVVILAVAAIFFVKSCKGGITDLFKTKTVMYHNIDTITRLIKNTDTLYKEITKYQIRTGVATAEHDTFIKLIYADGTTRTIECNNDTTTYTDSLRVNNEFKAILTQTINKSKRLNFDIKWANLQPIVEKTITDKTIIRQEALIKVFAGANVVLPTNYSIVKKPVDLAPAVSVLIKDNYLITASYPVITQQITFGLQMKLSFRKK